MLTAVFPTGRASLHDKASLRIEQVRSEDQGWYECKVLMLDQQYDTFHNGSWVHLTVNGEPGGDAASPGGSTQCQDGVPFDFSWTSMVSASCRQGSPKPSRLAAPAGVRLKKRNKLLLGILQFNYTELV